MKFWFDITNAPHVNFFEAMIKELQENGHEIIITARDHSNTLAMLELAGLSYTVVGRHYGKRSHHKLFGLLHRCFALWRHLRGVRIDAAIAHSSFYMPVVSRFLGCPSIYLNDNEHALGNIPAFLSATRIMIPETLGIDKVIRQGASRRKTVQYPGLKEGVYLEAFAAAQQLSRTADSDPLKTVYIRPEPWNAQYYGGQVDFLDDLIKTLAERFAVVVLPRGKSQGAHYRRLQSDRIVVIDSAISLPDIYRNCTLFIGAGGTMTREMAILGLPTISVYQDELLDVDRYLLDGGYLIHQPNPTPESVLQSLAMHTQKNGVSLLNKGREARMLILDTLVGLAAARAKK